MTRARRALALLVLWSLVPAAVHAETIARSGAGWLERIDGYPVLHLKGTPYEMGRQHGELLRDSVRDNLRNVLSKKGDEVLVELGPFRVTPRIAIARIVELQKPFVAERYVEEMRGLADGAGIESELVRLANFIPELFHCSGFALSGAATRDGTLYHGRVLDYATDWGLQEHAVIVVQEPDDGIPFVNVTYAGFIGSVTGMNAEHVSVGEMGGGGLGHWEGRPMALLVREVLEKSKSLDDAIAVFRDGPRTCQYFYVVADGETGRAVGMEASWDTFTVVRQGESHPLLPKGVAHSVCLSAGDRYEQLVERVHAGHGAFTAETALRLMDRPVAMKSNLHNVLFEPKSTRFWVANAGPQGEPAAEQPYHAFRLEELLSRKP
jgi:isopenicillin-N N-acyltransferase like protein